MPGGPINGVPWLGTLALVGGAGLASGLRRDADPNAPENSTGIIVPTVLQITADALSYWTNMTCLYDRYWEADTEKVTLPVCMFHVKKIVPTYAVETSKKRVILYEPRRDGVASAAAASDQMRHSVVQTVVDNAVKQPTTYSMEVIVPFQPVGRYVTEGMKMVSDIVTAMSDLFGGSFPDGFTDWWEGGFSTVFSVLKVAQQAEDLIGNLASMDGISYINKNSLEAMAESCRTLCMKMWTGFEYKYVVITSMTYEKQPAEDDVFRATLTLQEMPVLAITRPKDPKPASNKRNWLVRAISAEQHAKASSLISMTDVEAAAKGW